MATKKLWIAVAVGIALVGVLVALQLVDDTTESTRSNNASVQVKGIQASRSASLVGDIADADGWQVTLTVLGLEGSATADARPDGGYRVERLVPGPVEVSWVAQRAESTTDGVTIGGQRTGRTQVTLDAGRNRLDFTL